MGAAQRLTRLTLDGNTQLALSHSDAEALRRLPHLRALQVQHSETPPRVAARLRQLAPRVEAVWSIENAFHRCEVLGGSRHACKAAQGHRAGGREQR